MPSKKKDLFVELTWEDLRKWAGEKILSRGRGYQRSRSVKELARTADGGLVAWVRGSHRYATHVWLERRKIESACTCPYWDTCKHAVAVVVEYLDCVKKGETVPQAGEDDPRIKLLGKVREQIRRDDTAEGDEDDGEEVRALPSSSRIPAWKSLLESKSKEQLLDLVREFAEKNPEIRETLEDRAGLSRGAVGKMVKSIRQEIRNSSSEPGWSNYWKGERYTPDYSRVKERMESLLAHGHADKVVELGEELLRAGTSQVEMSHDEGETAMEISSCLEVAFRALHVSSLTPLDQMLWAIDAELKDEYSLCEGLRSFWERRHSKADWSQLADVLLARLKEYPPGRGEDGYSRNYRRDTLSNWIIQALEESGRKKEVIPLCEREAEKTASYERLVKALIKARRWKEAEDWIHKGIRTTEKKWPGIASNLRTNLKEIRAKTGDWHRVAAIEADEFFGAPSFQGYKDLQKAATRAGVWPAVKEAVMEYLKTGKSWRKDRSWPLPETGLKPAGPHWQPQFPMTDVLIDIAISEKKTEEVLRWHNASKSAKGARGFGHSRDEEVAKAVVAKYPDQAIAIWKQLAENQIGLTNPNAYRAAASYLRKIHDVLKRLHQDKEWHELLDSLRSMHARKRKFIEILNGLDGKRIVDE